METGQSPQGGPWANFTAYYNEDGFLLLSPSYAIDCTRHPYRRFTYSLYLGCRGDFQIELDNSRLLSAGAVLLSPGVSRKKVFAASSGIVIADFAAHTVHAMRLRMLMAGRRIMLLSRPQLQPIITDISSRLCQANTKDDINRWRAALLDALCPPCIAAAMDNRITKVMELIRHLPRGEVSLDGLACSARMSPSHLRHVFVEQTGMTIRQYARTQMLWRGVMLWVPGMALTSLAHEAGACDLAHFDRAHYEAFGRTPRALNSVSGSRLVRY